MSSIDFEDFDTFIAELEAETGAAKGGEGSGQANCGNSTSIPSNKPIFFYFIGEHPYITVWYWLLLVIHCNNHCFLRFAEVLR